MKEWWIGCSGFHYPEWKKVFYPEGLAQKRWFEYYSEHFNTLELNTTFYRFPQVPFLENWYKKSKAGFCFSVKVPRAITHFKQFNDTDRMLGDFYTTCREGLKEKLGCILFQLPGRVVYNEERLDKIIAATDRAYTNVIEFRHESWWNQGVYDKLATNGLSFCSMSHPDLPDQVVDGNVIYYRFHGVPKLYKSQYKKDKVIEVMQQALSAPGGGRKFIYFNNTMAMGGIRNARQAMAFIEKQQRVP
jgi:uncharacterized protein YecE (DUF72 family)